MSMQPAPARRKSLSGHKAPEDQGALFVIFELAAERYGAGIDCVQEIIKPPGITEIPHAPEYLSGVINLRGRIVPVVDLRRKLHMEPRPLTPDTRIIVALADGHTLGMIVDRALAVRPIPERLIEPPPPMFTAAVDPGAISGLARIEGELVTLLDLRSVLAANNRPAPDANG
jgi:purine-binding chemotaxis protein CheW